jgi:hypothetical protein
LGLKSLIIYYIRRPLPASCFPPHPTQYTFFGGTPVTDYTYLLHKNFTDWNIYTVHFTNITQKSQSWLKQSAPSIIGFKNHSQLLRVYTLNHWEETSWPLRVYTLNSQRPRGSSLAVESVHPQRPGGSLGRQRCAISCHTTKILDSHREKPHLNENRVFFFTKALYIYIY